LFRRCIVGGGALQMGRLPSVTNKGGTMHMRRKILLGVLALALPMTSVAFLQAPAQAKVPKFIGAATGTVSCTGVTVKISFFPPLTANTGGSTGTFKGKVSNCTVTGSTGADKITKGKLTGTFTGASTGVQGLILGITSAIHLNIAWKGTHGLAKASFTPSSVTLAGAAASFDPNVGFELPNPDATGANTVTGSFAGAITHSSTAYSSQSVNAVGIQSGKKHGLKKLVATHGRITLP
jgi:hypothetical protein